MNYLSEMMAKNRSDYLSAIQQGNSFFGEIPSDLGSIVYCDSTNSLASPDDPEVVKKKRVNTVLISLAILILIWVLLHNSTIWAIILSIVIIVIAVLLFVNTSSFSGTDFFVGTEGFAEIKFDKTRNNIVNRKKYYFKDFSEFLTGETYKKVNYTYQGTDYFGVFMGKPNDENEVDALVGYSGTYHQKNPKDDILEQDYLFLKAVENAWSNFKLIDIQDELKRCGSYTFNIIASKKNSSKYLVLQYIKFTNDALEIGGRVYNNETLKRMYFTDGKLVVENVNYTKKLFGIIEKGQKEEIPLTNVGNRKLFLMFLDLMRSPI